MLLRSTYKAVPWSLKAFIVQVPIRIITTRIARAFARLVFKIQKFMSLYPYLKVILFFTIHHPIHYRKLCLIIS